MRYSRQILDDTRRVMQELEEMPAKRKKGLRQIITHYEVFDERPSDRELLLSSVETQIRKLGRVPPLVAAAAGFYSQAQE